MTPLGNSDAVRCTLQPVPTPIVARQRQPSVSMSFIMVGCQTPLSGVDLPAF
jgi:hypothetical protein